MPIRKQIVPISLTEDIDAGGSDPKVVSGKLLRCENGVHKLRGAVAKREGTTSLGTATDATEIASHKTTGIAFGSGSLYDTALSGSPSLTNNPHTYATRVKANSVYKKTGERFVQAIKANSDGEVVTLEHSSVVSSGSPTRVGFNSILYVQSKENSSGVRQTLELTGTVASTGTSAAYETGEPVTAATHASLNGADFHVFYLERGHSGSPDVTLKYRTVSSSSIGSAVSPTVTNAPYNGLAASPSEFVLDAMAVSGSDALVCYANSATSATLANIGGAPSTLSESWYTTVSHTTAVGAQSIGRFVSGGTTYYAWVTAELKQASSNRAIKLVVVNSSGATQFGTATPASYVFGSNGDVLTQICCVQPSTSSSDLYVFYTLYDSTNYGSYRVEMVVFTESGGTFTAGSAYTIANGMVIASKPFYDYANNEVHILLEGPACHRLPGATSTSTTAPGQIDDIGTQHSWYLFRVDTSQTSGAIIVGKGEYGRSGTFPATNSSEKRYTAHFRVAGLETSGVDAPGFSVSRSAEWDDGTGATAWTAPCQYYHSETTVGAGYLNVDTRYSVKRTTAEGNGVTYIGNSCPYEYDGDTLHEQGFLYFPEVIGAVGVTSGGSWASTGTVTIYVLYEWTDANGNVHQSAPSLPYNVTIAATTHSFTPYAPQYPFSARKQGVKAVLYRTARNGNIPYRIQSKDAQSSSSGVITFDAVTGSETLFFSLGQSAYAAEEVLYTYNGSLPNVSPDPHYICGTYQSRYFYIPDHASDTTIRFGHKYVDGRGTETSNLLEISMQSDNGDGTAVGSLDEKQIIFKNDRCYAISGEGPGRTGAQNPFASPRIISSAVGCIDPRTVVLIPDGLMFLSRQGIYLLGRDERLVFIGESVRYYTNTYTYSGATVDPVNHVAVFISSSGPALAYDYMYNKWSTWSGTYDSCTGVTFYNGRLAVIKSTGACHVSDGSGTDYLDNSSAYSLKIETSWINAADILGYQRIYGARLLCDNLSDHTLRIKTAYDHDPYWVDSQTFDATTLQQFGEAAQLGAMTTSANQDESYKVEFGCSRSRCDAVRFQISDEAPGGGGDNAQALTISGMALQVGVHPKFGSKASKEIG